MEIDPRLIAACKRSDRKAQAELYRHCYQVLMGVCMRYAGQKDEAVAALNLGFLKILDKLDTWQKGVPFEAWIRRIMINTLIDEFRRNRRYREQMSVVDFQEHTHMTTAIDYNEAEQRLDAAAIEAMIQTLPPMSRQVFNLFAIDGYSHREIATLCGISEGTSKWHVSFARKSMQDLIAASLRTHHRTEVSEL
ncbi:MAG: sigma-70 family RNA polymerase sigma factor [Bacteroidia bacterium]